MSLSPMQPSHVRPKLLDWPSISGLAQSNDSGYLAVHDVKSGQPGERVTRFEPATGALEKVEVDFSATDEPSDLEGISRMDGTRDGYMAVEGSRYEGRTPKLFVMNYEQGRVRSEKQFDLPELPYEVEGVATRSLDNDKMLVLLGGRGEGIREPGRLHWGVYDSEKSEMSWPESGVAGVEVKLPHDLGEGQRSISDLEVTSDGDLWAAGAVDEGDEGPFQSLIYRIGKVQGDVNSPVTLTLDQSFPVENNKVEGLAASSERRGALLYGADNETFGGSMGSGVYRR